MSKVKAVILEKHGYRCTVLCEDGTFRHAYRPQNAEVGEEIFLRNGLESFRDFRAWVGVAVIFFMVFTTLIGWNLYQAPTAVALVSVDINPSIQFSVDDQGNLLTIDTQNEDAEQLLNQVDLKGKAIDMVVEQFVTEAYQHNYLNSELPWIVVGYSSLDNGNLEQDSSKLNESQIVSLLTENARKNGFTPQVAFFALTSEERELAQKGHLTLGEYALWQTAVKAGVATQEDKLNDTIERVRLLENPKVQAQLKEDKEELETSSPQTKSGKSETEKSKTEKDNQKKEQDKGNNNKDNVNKENMEKTNNENKDSVKTRGSDQGNQPTKNTIEKKQEKDMGGNGKGQVHKVTERTISIRNNPLQEFFRRDKGYKFK